MNRLLSRPMAVPIAICLALGAVSLLLPSEPSYDPWAWMVWGRELTLLQLDTKGGPSFKPLPVLVTAVVSPLSKVDDGIPPALWLMIARAGGLPAAAGGRPVHRGLRRVPVLQGARAAQARRGTGDRAAGAMARARVDRLGQPPRRRAEGDRRAALEPLAAR